MPVRFQPLWTKKQPFGTVPKPVTADVKISARKQRSPDKRRPMSGSANGLCADPDFKYSLLACMFFWKRISNGLPGADFVYLLPTRVEWDSRASTEAADLIRWGEPESLPCPPPCRFAPTSAPTTCVGGPRPAAMPARAGACSRWL